MKPSKWIVPALVLYTTLGTGLRAQDIDASQYVYGATCANGTENAYIGFFDTGDHIHYVVEVQNPPRTGYAYTISDYAGTLVSVSVCTGESNQPAEGCNGQITLPRPAISGETSVFFQSSNSIGVITYGQYTEYDYDANGDLTSVQYYGVWAPSNTCTNVMTINATFH